MHDIRKGNQFEYVDKGEGRPIILLHGLLGSLSNWQSTIDYFQKNYRVIIPILPIFTLPVKATHLESLVSYLENFINWLHAENITIIGNSLGGHVGLVYALKHSDKVNSLILTGSSGLFENTMGGSYPKRGNYQYIKEKTEYTFYNPRSATKELVDDVFEVVNNSAKCRRLIIFARFAQKHNLRKQLPNIKVPTLLVWGLNDTITPPSVAHEFDNLIPNTELHFLDQCSHVPMMEHPNRFNTLLENFLVKQESHQRNQKIIQ